VVSVKRKAEDKPVGKDKKKRSKKDKNAPKGAKSAYAIYVQQTRADLKASNPDASFGDLARLVADAWKNLTPDGRAKFEVLAKEDKSRFTAAMKEYKDKGGTAAAAAEDDNDEVDDEGDEDDDDA
jgi:structure-specific recognition protein 1